MEKKGLATFAIVAAVGLLTLVVTDSISISQQQAEGAKSAKGECASFLKNASASLCHNLSTSNSAEEAKDSEVGGDSGDSGDDGDDE